MYVFPNKLTLIHRRNTSNQIAAITCLAWPGAVNDSPGKTGQAYLMARMLTKGTKTRTADDISQTLEGMGASLSTSAAYDYMEVSLKCVRNDLPQALEVMADVMRNPTFPLDEIRAEKLRAQAEIRMREDNSASAVIKRLRSNVFGSHPYGQPIEGEAESIERVTQTDLVLAQRFAFEAGHIIISIVGDFSEEEAKELVFQYFGDMPASSEPIASAGKTFAPIGSFLEFQRDVEQGFVAMGTPGTAVTGADAAALEVATAILGQGMSSRLFQELRDKRGLAYSTGASAAMMRQGGYFITWIATAPENIDRVLAKPVAQPAPVTELGAKIYGESQVTFPQNGDALWDQPRLMREEPVRPEELERAKSYLIGNYQRRHESNAQQAFFLAYWQFHGLGIEYDQRYPDALRAVTSHDVMRVANKYWNDPAVVVLRPSAK